MSRDELEKVIDNLRAHKKILFDEIRDLNDGVDGLHKHIRDLKVDHDSLKDDITNLEDEKCDLKDDIADLEGERDSLFREIDTATESLSRIKLIWAISSRFKVDVEDLFKFIASRANYMYDQSDCWCMLGSPENGIHDPLCSSIREIKMFTGFDLGSIRAEIEKSFS